MPTRDDLLDIAVDDQHIAGTLVTPGTLVPGVLFVHGWGGSQEQYVARARSIAALGCVCLTFDLRGHAKTRAQVETVTREDNLRDVLAAYDALIHQRGVDASAVAVVGSSYGGYLAAILTSVRSVRWLALRAPADYKDSDWSLPKGQLRKRQELDAYRRLVAGSGQSRALAACAVFKGQVLIVESELDTIVPQQVVSNYRAAFTSAASLTVRVLEKADHSLSSDDAQATYTAALVAWLKEMIGRARKELQMTPLVATPSPTPLSSPAD
ncbi:MAG: alpha/beta fold hydrolase [Betaproteobacteria bacterium]